MEFPLAQISVRGFKSFYEAEAELRPMNVMIGANSAGKSNFVSLFPFIEAAVGDRLHEHVLQGGGPDTFCHYGLKNTPRFSLRFTFRSAPLSDPSAAGGYCSYDSVYAATHANTLIEVDKAFSARTDMAGHGASESPGACPRGIERAIRDFLGRMGVYQFHDTSATARVRGMAYVHDNGRLRPDGQNLAAFLYYLRERHPGNYRSIIETVRQTFPHFDDFDVSPLRLNADQVTLNWRERDRDVLFGPQHLSDGLLRFIALCALLLQPPREMPPLMVIDEPELGLHPYATRILASLMQKASCHCQVIAATQSVTLVNEFGPEDIMVVDRLAGLSTLKRPDPAKLHDWLEEYTLGELWEKNVLGGRPAP